MRKTNPGSRRNKGNRKKTKNNNGNQKSYRAQMLSGIKQEKRFTHQAVQHANEYLQVIAKYLDNNNPLTKEERDLLVTIGDRLNDQVTSVVAEIDVIDVEVVEFQQQRGDRFFYDANAIDFTDRYTRLRTDLVSNLALEQQTISSIISKAENDK